MRSHVKISDRYTVSSSLETLMRLGARAFHGYLIRTVLRLLRIADRGFGNIGHGMDPR